MRRPRRPPPLAHHRGRLCVGLVRPSQCYRPRGCGCGHCLAPTPRSRQRISLPSMSPRRWPSPVCCLTALHRGMWKMQWKIACPLFRTSRCQEWINGKRCQNIPNLQPDSCSRPILDQSQRYGERRQNLRTGGCDSTRHPNQ